MTPDPPASPEARQLKRKKDKVRAAWISFIGRIVAQIVGAVASVTLGLMLLSKYTFPERAAGGAPPVTTPSSPQPVAGTTGRATGGRSIAVMPFQNFSKDASHAYFADGVTETLITELAQIAGLHVTSRTSSMAYKATTKSLPVVARELGVALILEGSVVRDQALVRVTAQLIDANTDQHLWARSYDRPIRNLLPVQAEVARSIVRDVSFLVKSGPTR